MCMKDRTQDGVAWALFLSLLMGLFLFGCNEAPFAPKDDDPVEELTDYPVYMKEGFDPGWIFAYHPLTNTVDSFYWLTEGPMIVSADGRKLYCRPDGSSTVAAVDLDSIQCGDTLAVDHMLPFNSVVAVSPNNQFMAVLDSGYNGFSIVRASDYSVIFQDTVAVGFSGTFTQDSRRFYGGGVVVDLNVAPSVIRRWSCPFGRLDYLIPSKDESVWYLMVKVSLFFDFQFLVYDPNADSVLFNHYLTPGLGEIKLAPDSRVLFTNPGTGPIAIGPHPPPFFHVYDPETNSANDTIWATGVCSLVEASPIGELVITPDGRWLVGIHPGFGEILTFNLESMQLAKCFSLGHGHSLSDLSCQQIP